MTRSRMAEGKVISTLATEAGWTGAMGMSLDVAEPERVELSWTVGPEHLQPWGLVHGGVFCGAVETACSIGASLNLEPGLVAVGMENQTSFLRPVRSGALRVVATPRHRGRSSQLWQADVLDEQQRVVATGRLRLMAVPAAPAAPRSGESA